MKDFLGKTCKVGDAIVFMEVSYRGLLKGVITKISPKKVTISYGKKVTYQFHDQVIKIQET